MRTATLVLFVLSVTSSALAGTYTFVVDRNPISPAKPNFMNEYAIVHPIGYDGSGGALQIGVCVESGDEDLIPSVERAIRIWNELIPATGNCENCGIWEDPNPVMGPIDTAATILHEFGHCGLGLDHINAVEHTGFPTFWSVGTCDLDSDGNCGSSTSFTPFINPTEIMNTPGTPRAMRRICPSINVRPQARWHPRDQRVPSRAPKQQRVSSGRSCGTSWACLARLHRSAARSVRDLIATPIPG